MYEWFQTHYTENRHKKQDVLRQKNSIISFDDTAFVFQHFMEVRFMGHTTRYTCPIKKMLICKEEKEMGIVVSVMALVLYVPMSMVFVFGGKK